MFNLFFNLMYTNFDRRPKNSSTDKSLLKIIADVWFTELLFSSAYLMSAICF